MVPVPVLLAPEYREPFEEANTNSLAASTPFGCEREGGERGAERQRYGRRVEGRAGRGV